PNPTTGHTLITVPQSATFTLSNNQGQLVYSSNLIAGENTLELPLYLPDALYFYSVMTEGYAKASGRLILSR
ncbi:MAG TPA: T9SS type A sorting domain-containing protein, partial [Flavipsychrobacter sp.]|nr:T9SS type A sorting domain-containing protein [Flavipsychrobacter sp.]